MTVTFGSKQIQTFNNLKKYVSEAGTVSFFDKKAKTTIIANASPVGLEAVLIQEQNGSSVPVHYASRNLSDCKKRYSQTEKEALSLVWACEKFHMYVYGIKSNLVTVIYEQRSKPCARKERWVLLMQPYDFGIVYITGHRILQIHYLDCWSQISRECNTCIG